MIWLGPRDIQYNFTSFKKTQVTSNKIVHKKRFNCLAYFSYPFHMFCFVVSIRASTTIVICVSNLLFSTTQKLVLKANILKNTFHRHFKHEKQSQKKFLFTCTFLFEVSWTFKLKLVAKECNCSLHVT